MALNIPSYTQDDITYGPGRLFVGAAGTTPTVDLGAIDENGISIGVSASMTNVVAGNPKTTIARFTTEQNVAVKATGVEWNYDNLSYALGGATIATTSTYERFSFGGDPCPDEVALHIQHQMCRTGDTLNVYVWRGAGTGNVDIALSEVHKFPYEWMALHADEDWAGSPLAAGSSLFRIERQLA